MALNGSLAVAHLPDVVQLVSSREQTGVLHLVDGPLEGRLWLTGGEIVHAELGQTRGEEAVYALATWERGEFRFVPGPPADIRTIARTNTELIMEAARRMDDWKRLSPAIPSLDLVPEFVTDQGTEGQINLNTGQWLILSKVDGRRSLRVIAAGCGLSVFEAARLLHDLVAAGLIRLTGAPPPAGGAA
jgi:hypothetical protein